MPQTDFFRPETCNDDTEFAAGCRYQSGYLPAQDADGLLNTLWADLPWRQQKIWLFGKEVMQPRLLCWQADRGVNYSYSGLALIREPWHRSLDGLRNRMYSEFGLVFNSVLVNAYRNGRDSMGWHSDDEPELGREPSIASISLGAERVFRIRVKQARTSSGLVLEHGSLLLMSGQFQTRHQHCVPKSTKVNDLRINLTFRQICSA